LPETSGMEGVRLAAVHSVLVVMDNCVPPKFK
jgi:hypothetical protein